MTAKTEAALPTLARRAADGDREALDELLIELEPQIVRTARLIVGSGSWAAEDAAQEAMLDITQGLPGLREPEAVRSWALRTATTRAIKVARRERLMSLRRTPSVDRALAADPGRGRADALRDAFARLPPRLRATAVLRLYVGLSEAETAEVMSCSVGAVKSNLNDARKRLTKALAQHGFAPVTMTAREETVE